MKKIFWCLIVIVAIYIFFNSIGYKSEDTTTTLLKPSINSDNGTQNLDSNSEMETYLEFKGDPCTIDCSGHEAGYYWAEENGIYDPSDCGGNSNSFIEGCISYTEEN